MFETSLKNWPLGVLIIAHTHTHTHTHTKQHAHTHTHTNTTCTQHAHTHTHTCMYTHTYTRTHVHTHTHTHTHTHPSPHPPTHTHKRTFWFNKIQATRENASPSVCSATECAVHTQGREGSERKQEGISHILWLAASPQILHPMDQSSQYSWSEDTMVTETESMVGLYMYNMGSFLILNKLKGHSGSWYWKQGWIVYWQGVILSKLGHKWVVILKAKVGLCIDRGSFLAS